MRLIRKETSVILSYTKLRTLVLKLSYALWVEA